MAALATFGVVLILGLAVTVPAYARLLRSIREQHPGEFERLGRPSLFMGSPARSLALQRFIYLESREPGISPEVAGTCRFLGIVTPLYVAAVFVTMGWFLADVAARLSA